MNTTRAHHPTSFLCLRSGERQPVKILRFQLVAFG